MVPVEFFFGFEVDLYQKNGAFQKKHCLPELALIFHDEIFAQVSLAWDESGLYALVDVNQELNAQATDKNSVELFIDTKNLKTTKTTHRFCHEFIFFPERIEGILGKEITRFRSEDTHPYCLPEDLEVKVKRKSAGYQMEIYIPEKCLVGFQPEKGSSIGFTYRINREGKASQHFNLSSSHCQLEFCPHLWSSLKLV